MYSPNSNSNRGLATKLVSIRLPAQVADDLKNWCRKTNSYPPQTREGAGRKLLMDLHNKLKKTHDN